MAVTAVTLLAWALMNEDDAAAYLKIPVPTSSELETFQNIINAATRRVESYCSRPFVSRSVDETYDGNGLVRLPLNKYPIVSVTTLEWLDTTTGGILVSYTPTQFRIDSRLGYLYLTPGEVFTAGQLNWRVVYAPGWNGLASVPDDVILAAKMLVARMWRDYTERKDDVESVSFEGQTVTYNKDPMPPKVRGLLDPWRAPSVRI
jgi:hypothetical protein